jgi:hypothetical protein
MLKIIFSICISFLSFANGLNIQTSYDVSYGIFGHLGEADAKVFVDSQNHYKIHINAYTDGLVKTLSDNLQESYTSIGIFENDRFKPLKFTKITSKNSKIKILNFTFDYDKKQIILKKTVKKLKNNVWKEEIKKETVKYWAQEDILSLFFNLKHYISNLNESNIKSISAVGAGKSNGGKIDIEIPTGEKRKTIAKYLRSDKNILIVKIYNKLFTSSSGELFLKLDKNGLCELSILKDILIFGDIVGKRKQK